MTTRPHLRIGSHLLPGLAAVALFAVMALAVLPAGFGPGVGIDTTVANESVSDTSGADVEVIEGEWIVAVVEPDSGETRRVAITDRTDVETEIVKTDDATYINATSNGETVANVSVASTPDVSVEDTTQTLVVARAHGKNNIVTDQTGLNTEVVRTGSGTYVVASHGITSGIGRALIDQQHAGHSEGFLAAFEIVDLVLVAALVAAVMLARREIEGQVVTALFSEAAEGAEAEAATDGGPEADEDGGDA